MQSFPCISWLFLDCSNRNLSAHKINHWKLNHRKICGKGILLGFWVAILGSRDPTNPPMSLRSLGRRCLAEDVSASSPIPAFPVAWKDETVEWWKNRKCPSSRSSHRISHTGFYGKIGIIIRIWYNKSLLIFGIAEWRFIFWAKVWIDSEESRSSTKAIIRSLPHGPFLRGEMLQTVRLVGTLGDGHQASSGL